MPPPSPVSIEISEGIAITVFESDEDGKCGYATRIWDCSVGVSRWMLESLPYELLPEARPLRGCRIVELGAGTALCSLAILLVEPECQVTATDVDPASLPLIHAAAEALYKSHGRGLGNLQTEVFDITADTALPPCDLLIASDACYTTELATALAKRCVQALQASPTARVPSRESNPRELSQRLNLANHVKADIRTFKSRPYRRPHRRPWTAGPAGAPRGAGRRWLRREL